MLSEDTPDRINNAPQTPLFSTPNLATLSVPAEVVTTGDAGLLFAPLRNLESSPAPPDLSLPDLPYVNASSPLTSPTPLSVQNDTRKPPHGSPDTPRVGAMLVDEETTSTPIAPTVLNTPTIPTVPNSPVAPTVPNTPVVLLQDIVDPLPFNDDEPDLTPISNHLEGSLELQTGNLPSNPLDKFMRGPFPPVHVSLPEAAYVNIAKSTATAWDSFPTYKLLAIPFGFDARVHRKHGILVRGILSAVAEITNSQRIGVAAPAPEERPIKTRNRTPLAFLIHGLSRDHYRILYKQRFWVSNDISFRVTSTKPSPPDLLFSITELSSLNSERVHEMVLTIWSRNATISALQDIINNYNYNDPTSKPDIKSFLATLKTDCLLIKEKGGILNPIYNIYANGKYFRHHELWSLVRSSLAGLTYGASTVGTGVVRTAHFHCTVCHAADHPRGLCPFPKMQGWKGPLGFPEDARN